MRLTENPSGELLLDQQRYPDAIEKFERAVEIERAKYVDIALRSAALSLTTITDLHR